MTTCAVKAGVVAADTQLTSGNTIYRVTKLFRLPDGGVATGCGDWQEVYQALKWLEAGEHGDCPEFPDGTLMICRPDGSIWLADDKFLPYPVLGDSAAIGCGSQAAQVAMYRGSTARQAVEGVAAGDPMTSGPVETMKVRSK